MNSDSLHNFFLLSNKTFQSKKIQSGVPSPRLGLSAVHSIRGLPRALGLDIGNRAFEGDFAKMSELNFLLWRLPEFSDFFTSVYKS